jgi:hypothetical protein
MVEQLKTGPDRARHNIINQYRQRRHRQLQELRKSKRWESMSMDEREVAEKGIFDVVNKERDTAIGQMTFEWNKLTAVILENEAHLPSIADAPDTESDCSDSEFEEDDDEAIKTGVPHQTDSEGRFQPDSATRSDLMAIFNRHVKSFQARTDVLEFIGVSDEEPFIDVSSDVDESDEVEAMEKMEDETNSS